MRLNTFVKFIRMSERPYLNAVQQLINRMQPTERQPSVAIFSIIDGQISVLF